MAGERDVVAEGAAVTRLDNGNRQGSPGVWIGTRGAAVKHLLEGVSDGR